jgi:hypothetical protein
MFTTTSFPMVEHLERRRVSGSPSVHVMVTLSNGVVLPCKPEDYPPLGATVKVTYEEVVDEPLPFDTSDTSDSPHVITVDEARAAVENFGRVTS